MWHRIRVLMWKEFIELRRDPRLFGLIVVAPVLQLTVLGYAATTDVRHVPIVVVDGDRSEASRQLIGQFAASPHFNVVGEADAPKDVDRYLMTGKAWLALAIPSGFSDALDGHGDAALRKVQLLADGSDANSSGLALAYASSLVGQFNQRRAADAGVVGVPLDGRVRVWFNPQLESRDFMVPGVIALLLLVVTSNLSSMAIVREREVGTLEQLNVSPLGRWELILGKLLPYSLIGFIDVLLVCAVAVFWFEIPLRGSVALLLAGSALYLLSTLGLGLLSSSLSSTQQQAMMTTTFFFMLPMIYLSGFIFPIENMPTVIQWVTYAIPLRYFLVIVRGIFLKGIGWDILWPQFAALASWGVIVITLAAARTKKRG
ncbi:MAG: ABC transporter permease [Acidobacteria bacterium]|nr:MAG: ABC transporter permease [Acidobacteriota bacterium]